MTKMRSKCCDAPLNIIWRTDLTARPGDIKELTCDACGRDLIPLLGNIYQPMESQ